jgi:hypothetical protein
MRSTHKEETMPTEPIRQVALISESSRVNFNQLAVASAALQKQVLRDASPIWNVRASVDPFAALEDMPVGYWPMIIKDNIDFAAAGIHLDRDGQPFALITADDDSDVWSLTASHECLEMLVDPFGNKQVAGDSTKPDQSRVSYLVEVCDPSEAAQFAYSVNGVLVSDFYTPEFFDPVVGNGVRYSFTGAIKEPRQVLEGGYLSWLDPETGHWWQETWFEGNQSTFVDLGELTAANGSIRAQIDRLTEEARERAIKQGRRVARAAGLTLSADATSYRSKAASLRQQIDQLVQPGARGQRGRATVTASERTARPHRRGARRI